MMSSMPRRFSRDHATSERTSECARTRGADVSRARNVAARVASGAFEQQAAVLCGWSTTLPLPVETICSASERQQRLWALRAFAGTQILPQQFTCCEQNQLHC